MFELFESCFLSYTGCSFKRLVWCPNDLESISIEEYGYVKMYSSMKTEYECEVVNSQKCTHKMYSSTCISTSKR